MTTTRPDTDTALADLFAEVLGSAITEGSDLDRTLWNQLRELGLTTIMSEQDGTWTDAVTALRATAAAGANIPLAEHDLLANWLRHEGGLSLQDQPSIVTVAQGGHLVDHTAWRMQADHVVVLRTSGDTVTVTDHAVGSPAHDAPCVGVGPGVLWEYRLRGALARSAQISGAMTAAVDLTIRYARERTQFGRAIATFQAVQHLITDALAETALALTSVDAAAAAAERSGLTAPESVAAVATAKSVTARAASVVVRNTHQVHGAIGTTSEHPLHRRTLPVLAWRNDFGSAVEWETLIAERLRHTERTVWSWIAAP